MQNRSLLLFGFETNPFVNSIKDKRLFHRTEKYNETLLRMHEGIREPNTDITMIYGEIGVGKSYTSAILTSELDDMGYYVTYIPNSYELFEILMCSIVSNISDKNPTSITEATLYFEELLKRLEQERNQLVIILDECHTYDIETLDKIRQLSNYNAKSETKLLSLVLVGQTELMTKVKTMRQLYSRIKVKQYLECLKEGEILEYIEFKIRAVGYDRSKENPFRDHIKEIYEATKGMQRLINNVCEAAIDCAADENKTIITKEIMAKGIEEILRKQELYATGG
jgi:type II secretory pathway predicted ATPase ExeA